MKFLLIATPIGTTDVIPIATLVATPIGTTDVIPIATLVATRGATPDATPKKLYLSHESLVNIKI